MSKFISLHLILVLFRLSNCTSSFDQRQTGDLNVQIGLKNIQLIALLKGGNEEYVDYDYAYDYSEMTIKPQNGTTPKPFNITNTQSQHNVTTLRPLADNTTEISMAADQHINGTEQIINADLNINATGSRINSTAVNMAGIVNETASTAATNYTMLTTRKVAVEEGPTTVTSDSTTGASASTATVVSINNCRRGFVQNNQGKCEYKVHGTSNALRRIVKLAQKIKIGRGFKGT